MQTHTRSDRRATLRLNGSGTDDRRFLLFAPSYRYLYCPFKFSAKPAVAAVATSSDSDTHHHHTGHDKLLWTVHAKRSVNEIVSSAFFTAVESGNE